MKRIAAVMVVVIALQGAASAQLPPGWIGGGPPGPVPASGNAPQIMGYSAANTPEAETVSGCSFTRTGANAYSLGGCATSIFPSQSANSFLVAPDGSAGTPIFRGLVNGDFGTGLSPQFASSTVNGGAANSGSVLNVGQSSNATAVEVLTRASDASPGALPILGILRADHSAFLWQVDAQAREIADSLSVGMPTGGLRGTGTVNVATGYQVNGSAAGGHYLRGNGGSYVDGAIQGQDLPAAGTGTKGTAFATGTMTVTAPTAVGCTEGTATVSNALITMPVTCSPQSDPTGTSGVVSWAGRVSTTGTVACRVCNAAAETSPPATVYNYEVFN